MTRRLKRVLHSRPGALLLFVSGLGMTGAHGALPQAPGGSSAAPGPPTIPGQEGGTLLRKGVFTTVAGDTIRTDTLAGRVLLVNAWATWCGPCVLEMPGFQRVQDEFRDRGFLVIGVSADQDSLEEVRAFVNELGVTYPVTFGPHHALGRLAAQVRGLPTSFLLRRDGSIARTVEGVFPEADLRTAVEALLGEPGQRDHEPGSGPRPRGESGSHDPLGSERG